MKRILVLAFALFSVSLTQSGIAQSTPSTTTATTTKQQAKQDKQDKQVAKAQAKSEKDNKKAKSGKISKKTTTGQDWATALAYKEGLPK
jgi:hypothetical protein